MRPINLQVSSQFTQGKYLGAIDGAKSVQSIPNDKPTANAHIQDVVFVGAGSSIAYLLTELSDRHEESLSQPMSDSSKKPLQGSVTIIGESDAWSANNRGKGIINHQKELIDNWGEKAPQYSKSYADRQEFSKTNTDQINRAVTLGAHQVKDEVSEISKLDDGNFKIKTKNGQVLLSKQVILGIGAGPHTDVRKDEKNGNVTRSEKSLNNIKIQDKEKLKHQVLDLDQFIRATDAKDSLKGKTVVVHGPNAGIDAVERAGQLGANVKWFIRNTEPVLLDGNQLEHAPEVAKTGLVKVSSVDISASADEGRLNISTKNSRGEEKNTTADFYVFALGQDSEKEGAIKSILDESILSNLKPVYDNDQVYSDQPYKTVLGIQSKGEQDDQGLLIVGATVESLGRSVEHNYLDQIGLNIQELALKADLEPIDLGLLEENGNVVVANLKNKQSDQPPEKKSITEALIAQVNQFIEAKDYLDNKGKSVLSEIRNQTKTEAASVVVSPQLAAVKASIGALSNVMPKYISNGEANYASDNRTMLRVYIANSFPNVPEADAQKFIKDVIDIRSMTKSEFSAKIVQDTQHFSKILRETEGTTEARKKLTDVGIPLFIANELVSPSPSNFALDELGKLAEDGDIPAWGTPDQARYGYARKLSDLHLGVENNTPLSISWLKKSYAAQLQQREPYLAHCLSKGLP